jgi:very-short-patch-repair endonuclease
MNGWHALAARQYGVITRAQLRAAGLSNRQVDTRIDQSLERMYSGVFRVAGSYPSARQRAMAACLWCGPDALLSHSTAAGLFQLPVASEEAFHVTVPPAVRRQADLVTVHRSDVERRDRFQVDGLPVTSPSRTIIDLSSRLNGEELENTFESARRIGLLTKTVLERRASDRRVPAALREVLRVVDARPKESKLEVKVARLLRDHGLRPDAAQHRVDDFRIDFVWLAILLGLECDGFDWHGNRLAWKRDRRRIARLEDLGWCLLHVTWDDVTQRPDETISRIRQAIATRTSATHRPMLALPGRG